MTRADELAREMEAIAHDAERIQALSRTQPHVFLEQKSDVARRLRKLACELRNTFGGAPTRPTKLSPGRRPGGLRVEIRRARVA